MTRLHDLDLRALLVLYGGASGAWSPAMIALTVLGSWASIALVPLIGHPRTRRFATLLALAVAAQATLVWALKLAVGRVRPWIALGLPAPFGAPNDGSFPSGHAAGSFCVAAFLTVALPAAWPRTPGRARALAGATMVLAALVASSRVYLGAHFPVDVVCGAFLGAVIGVFAGRAYLSPGADGPVERSPERG